MTTASLITDTGVTLFLDNDTHVIPTDHPRYADIVEFVRAGDYDAVRPLLDTGVAVRDFVAAAGYEDFKMNGDFLTLDGKPFTFEVTEKVLNMMAVGNPVQPIYRFLRKVVQNPRAAAQDELLLFCVANNFMITDDGDILAYKAVRENYTDIYSGKFLNRPGMTVEMERTKVDDRRDVTCSTGLHFANYEYASDFGGSTSRLMTIKVNPADVVSIPYDYGNQKGRCWRYSVVSELPNNTPLPKREVYSREDVADDIDDDIWAPRYDGWDDPAAAGTDALEDDIDALGDRLGTTLESVYTLEDEIAKIEYELQGVHAKLTDLQDRNGPEREDERTHRERVGRIEAHLNERASESAELQSQAATYYDAVVAIEAEIESLRAELHNIRTTDISENF